MFKNPVPDIKIFRKSPIENKETIHPIFVDNLEVYLSTIWNLYLFISLLKTNTNNSEKDENNKFLTSDGLSYYEDKLYQSNLSTKC